MGANFDGRGTGYRGNKIMYQNYKSLGKYEGRDQIEFAKQISEMYDFIDASNMMIWGRSYGGYATSKVMGQDSEGVFKCGMIVAPVTDWALYSAKWTEKYLWSNKTNPDGYASQTTMHDD